MRKDISQSTTNGVLSESSKHQITQRLRQKHPEETSNMSHQELEFLVDRGHANALELDISNEWDVYRFISLQFLPRDFLNDSFIQSVLIRLLNNLDIPSSTRLDFIEKQIGGRRRKSIEDK
jgi:hypothetical protein